MVARKRRTKYTWLPVVGNAAIDPEGDPRRASFRDIGIVTAAGTEDLIIVPLVLDSPTELLADSPDASLADFIGSEYFIKRIVGKFFCSYTQSTVENFIPASVLVTAGFFIARADTGQNNALPVGTDDALNNYSPAAAINIREPWIWRRAWCLGNDVIPPSVLISPARWPSRNSEYGSVADGPHIDAKTARRVRKEERLFFAVSCGRLFSNAQEEEPLNSGGVSWCLDYRVLGALRKSVARGAF